MAALACAVAPKAHAQVQLRLLELRIEQVPQAIPDPLVPPQQVPQVVPPLTPQVPQAVPQAIPTPGHKVDDPVLVPPVRGTISEITQSAVTGADTAHFKAIT